MTSICMKEKLRWRLAFLQWRQFIRKTQMTWKWSFYPNNMHTYHCICLFQGKCLISIAFRVGVLSSPSLEKLSNSSIGKSALWFGWNCDFFYSGLIDGDVKSSDLKPGLAFFSVLFGTVCEENDLHGEKRRFAVNECFELLGLETHSIGCKCSIARARPDIESSEWFASYCLC